MHPTQAQTEAAVREETLAQESGRDRIKLASPGTQDFGGDGATGQAEPDTAVPWYRSKSVAGREQKHLTASAHTLPTRTLAELSRL